MITKKQELMSNINNHLIHRHNMELSVEGTTIVNKIFDMINLDPSVILKIKRTEDAKQFPLINIKKYGDVGFDLTAVLPYKKKWEKLADRENFIAYNNTLDIPRIESEVEVEVFRQQLTVLPHNKVVVPTGIFIECPAEYWASIEARSSTSANLLLVPKGVIDEGYRGELFAVLVNIGDKAKTIKHGERYVQLIVHDRNSAHITIKEVDELASSERGETGFGSTGKSDEKKL